jgi:cytochrome P450
MSEPLRVDLSDAEFWQDPGPVWRDARSRARTAVTQHGEPILLDADDVDIVSTDPAFAPLGVDALHRLGIYDGPFHEWRRLTLAAQDGADHERLRSVVGRAFTPRRVEQMRERLIERARSTLSASAEVGRFDVVSDYASDLPLWLLCQFLGLPVEARAEVATFLVGTEEGFVEPMTAASRKRAEEGIVALYAYVHAIVDERVESPREDLVSDLLLAEQNDRISRAELMALVVNIIGGAIGSTRAAISNSVLLLLTNPGQARWVREDFSRIRPAVEECLRYLPPFRGGRKKVTRQISSFGLELAPGSTVYIARPAVNRDPKRWDDPERFNVVRPEQRHYSFGYGPHFCLGQSLARLDIQMAVQAVLERFDDIELLDDRPRRVPFTVDEQIEALPVAIRPFGRVVA